MKILVCIKQINDNGDMNRFDESALEEALKIKEKAEKQKQTPVTSVSVDVISAGNSNSFKIIRRAFGMGSDHGFLIVLRNEEKKQNIYRPLPLPLFCLLLQQRCSMI